MCMSIKPQTYQLISHLLSLLMVQMRRSEKKREREKKHFALKHITFKWLLNCKITRLYVRYCVKCFSIIPSLSFPQQQHFTHYTRSIFVFNFYIARQHFFFTLKNFAGKLCERWELKGWASEATTTKKKPAHTHTNANIRMWMLEARWHFYQ